ncbi:MAG: hypothetical protein MJY79_09150, partial [Bacteroidaceae bacterium]|nr:hypothetical protein [Bacteroidaceae bacterium]
GRGFFLERGKEMGKIGGKGVTTHTWRGVHGSRGREMSKTRERVSRLLCAGVFLGVVAMF